MPRPDVALSESEQCCAWGRTTRRRCKLKKQHDLNVCESHVAYYDNWLASHPPISGWRLGGEAADEFRFQIERGFITVTPEYVRAIRNPAIRGHDYYSDFYEYLLRFPHIRPDDNKDLFVQLIRRYCYETLLGVSGTLDMYFGNLFANPHFNPTDFLIILANELQKVFIPNSPFVTTRDNITDILEQMLLHPSFEPLAYNPELVKQVYAKIPVGSHVLYLLTPQLEQLKALWYSTVKSKFYPMKEEFMAMTWHPDRLIDWCLDEEEKSDFA